MKRRKSLAKYGIYPQSYKPAVEPQPVPKDADLDHPSLYFNNELSWLDFNWRVFYQALDTRWPLLERVRFIAITANNLDEFVQKRVGGLKRQEAAGVYSLSPDGRRPTQQLDILRTAIRRMHSAMTEIWERDLRLCLRDEARIVVCDYSDLNKTERKKADIYFDEHIYPILTPLAVDPGHPFPFISNLSLSLAIVMRHPSRDTHHFARVKVPDIHGRWYRIRSGSKLKLLPLEQLVENNIEKLFYGMKIESVHVFRITRNADVRRDEEEAEDLLAMISEELRERRFASVVRLEVEKSMPDSTRQLLLRELDLPEADIYETDGLLDLSDCFEIANLDYPELLFEPWEPVVPKIFVQGESVKESEDIFSLIRKRDILVHHPYESFTATTQRFIEEAAADPRVLAIKQTLYRTSKGSPIVKALIRAAERGKQVAVLVEVTARFDEATNIEFGQMLETAGVHVTYGLVGLKTHCKVTLVIREEEDGPRAYCHIGTGNYHAQTTRIYSDYGLFTCAPEFGYDLINLFHYLTGHAPEQHYRNFLVAPKNMRQIFIDLIDREIEHHKKSGKGRILAKMNALDDVRMIRELYRASQAGVKIDLIIRGHSRLRPGLAGFSENIKVISIIGRFLEHDRLFCFHNNGEPMVLMGSADWRRRNLTDRVEAIVPIHDRKLCNRLIKTMEYALKDNRLAWDLDSDGTYRQRHPAEGEAERTFHTFLMQKSIKQAQEGDVPWDI
ncbi:polyphosphate kinase 1 [candidate division KSB1 bacterium]|nr:polyphosphate kinase 1 [candidate division KSB1 bacterium]